MLPPYSQPSDIKSRDEAEAIMAIVTHLEIQIVEQLTIKNKLAVEVQELQKKVQDLAQKQFAHKQRLNVWANSARQEWGEKKSLELRQGTIGFREGKRAVKFLANWTEEMVLAKLRKFRAKLYIRTKEEINKSLILSDTKPEVARLKETELKKVGLEICQDESFFCEPRIDQK